MFDHFEIPMHEEALLPDEIKDLYTYPADFIDRYRHLGAEMQTLAGVYNYDLQHNGGHPHYCGPLAFLAAVPDIGERGISFLTEKSVYSSAEIEEHGLSLSGVEPGGNLVMISNSSWRDVGNIIADIIERGDHNVFIPHTSHHFQDLMALPRSRGAILSSENNRHLANVKPVLAYTDKNGQPRTLLDSQGELEDDEIQVERVYLEVGYGFNSNTHRINAGVKRWTLSDLPAAYASADFLPDGNRAIFVFVEK